MNFKKYQASLNLYNAAETSWTSGVKDDNGNITGSTTSHFTSNYTAVESGTKYSITGIYASGSSTAARIYYYDSSKAWISRTAALRDNPLVFETPNNCAYIQVQCANGADGTNFMLVKGEYTSETMPSFEPYGGVWNSIPYYIYGTETDAFTSYPVTVYGDGETDISLLLKGNTETSGTPSPSNPVTIQGVGEETANLFDKDQTTGIISNTYINQSGQQVSAQSYYLSYPIEVIAGDVYTWSFNSLNAFHTAPTVGFYDVNDELIGAATHSAGIAHFTFTVPNNTAYLRASVYIGFQYNTNMLFKGSTTVPDGTPLEFIPYGMYEISICNNSSPLTPIYVSQPLFDYENTVDTLDSSGTFTKNIQYVVLTGNETFTVRSSPEHSFSFGFSSNNCGRGVARMGICSHFPTVTSADRLTDGTSYFGTTGFSFRIDTLDTLTDCTNYLKAQYAAGTPVTFIYCLSTAETESVTVPTITTTGGTATIDVDTTVKPSELDLTYHGWHTHEPLKRENGQWV